MNIFFVVLVSMWATQRKQKKKNHIISLYAKISINENLKFKILKKILKEYAMTHETYTHISLNLQN